LCSASAAKDTGISVTNSDIIPPALEFYEYSGKNCKIEADRNYSYLHTLKVKIALTKILAKS